MLTSTDSKALSYAGLYKMNENVGFGNIRSFYSCMLKTPGRMTRSRSPKIVFRSKDCYSFKAW